MSDSRVKKTIFSSLILQIVTIICGFILPRLILNAFGSAYNGIVNSVNQFLSCITLLRAGIGGVTRAALYKPLVNKDNDKVSAIIKSTEQFMRKIAVIYVLLLIIFATIYPLFVLDEFNWGFSFSLVLILGFSTIIQYYFGITYQFLLQADQKLYVYNFLQIGATIANTMISVILIVIGFEIRIVKLASASIFGIIPLILYFYIKKHYSINKKVEPDNTTIKQRWDAFAHQIAAFVNTNTDVMVLTICSDLYQVSIYSVYNMVVFGVKQLIFTVSNAIESMFGNTIAQNQEELLKKQVKNYEFVINILSLILLICTAILIVPFIMIYTDGVTDTNYSQPVFAFLLCFATFLSCIRLPYQNLVEAAGHFKQTRNGAILEAIINIVISVIFVYKFGCIGVAIGTIVAMWVRTIQYAHYASRKILKRDKKEFWYRMMVSIIIIVLIIIISCIFNIGKYILKILTIKEWIMMSIITVMVITIIVLFVNYIFYPDLSKEYIKIMINKLKKIVKI